MSDGGKGSAARPFSVNKETFADNWEATFGKKKKQEDTKTMPMPGTIGGAEIVFKEEATNNDLLEQKYSGENK